MEISNYSINTMTLTAKSNLDADVIKNLKLHVDHHTSQDKPFVAYYAIRRGDKIDKKGGIKKKNGKPRSFSERMFDNQSTVVVHMPTNGGYNLNIKIFKNGNLQMTGARSVEDGKIAAEYAMRFVNARVYDIEIRLINSNFKVSKLIDRARLHEIASDVIGVTSSFNQSIYPGVKMYYMHNASKTGKCSKDTYPCGCCKRVTILVFYTGAIIITGATSVEQIDSAYEWISGVLKTYEKDVMYVPS